MKMKKLWLSLSVLIVALVSMSMIAFGAELQKPGQVTGLKQTASGEKTIDISWTADITPNVRYDVYLSTTGAAGSFVKQTSDYGTSSADYSFYSLTPGATYYVQVKAFTYDYSSRLDADKSSATLAVCTTPTEVLGVKQIGATTSSVKLTWNKSAGATGYFVYDEVGSSKKRVATVTTNSATIKNLSSAREHNLVVYPYKKVGSFTTWNKYYSSTGRLSNYNLKFQPNKVSTSKIDVDNYWDSLSTISITLPDYDHMDGYQAVAYTSKGKKVFSDTSSSRYLDLKKVKARAFYKIKVRGYSVINGKNVYGAWSSYKYVAHQPDVTSMKQVGSNKQAKIKWQSVSGATSYTVYMSTKRTSGYKKVATVKGTSATVSKIGSKKLAKNKKYYVYVVANKKVGGTTFKAQADYCWNFKLTR